MTEFKMTYLFESAGAPDFLEGHNDYPVRATDQNAKTSVTAIVKVWAEKTAGNIHI